RHSVLLVTSGPCRPPLFPYTTLFRSGGLLLSGGVLYVASYQGRVAGLELESGRVLWQRDASSYAGVAQGFGNVYVSLASGTVERSEEHTSELQSRENLVCRLLLEKKK